MNYLELRKRVDDEGLANPHDRRVVWFARDEGPGAPEVRDDTWTIIERDGKYVVGGVERLEFAEYSRYDTEDDACDAIYRLLTRTEPVRHRTAEERAESRRRMQEKAQARLQQFKDVTQMNRDSK